MAKVNLNTIKNWFKTGLIPTQNQFWDVWDSFWHKDNQIPVDNIENLGNLLNNKADTEALQNHNEADDSHSDLFNALKGRIDENAQEIESIQSTDYLKVDDVTKAAKVGLSIQDKDGIEQWKSTEKLKFGKGLKKTVATELIEVSDEVALKDVENTFQAKQNFLGGARVWDVGSADQKNNLTLRANPSNTDTSNPRFYDIVAYGRNSGAGWKSGLNFIVHYSGGDEQKALVLEAIDATTAKATINANTVVNGDFSINGAFVQPFCSLTRTSSDILTFSAFDHLVGSMKSFRDGSNLHIEDVTIGNGGGSGWSAHKDFYVSNTSEAAKQLALRLAVKWISGEGDVLQNEIFGELKVNDLDLSNLGSYTDDAAAASGGVKVGFAYINNATGAMHRRLT